MNNNELTQKKSAGDAGTSTDTVSNDTIILTQIDEKVKQKFDLIDFGAELRHLIRGKLNYRPLITTDATDYGEYSLNDIDLMYKFEDNEYAVSVSFSLSRKTEDKRDE